MNRPEILRQSFWPSALNDLQIVSGTAMQVELASSSQRFKSEWVGTSESARLYIKAPQGVGRLIPGTRLRVRVLQENWICAFSTQIQHHISQPEALWVLDYPDQIEVARLREDTRLPVALRVKLDAQDPLEGVQGVNGLLNDLHMQGASVLTHMPIGELGEQIFVTTRLAFAGTEQLVMLPAQIVNHKQAQLQELYTEQYGLRFEPLDDETRVYLQGYLAQMQLSYLGY